MAARAARHVAAAELDGVHDERGDLVQRDAVLPAVGQRVDLLRRPRSVVAEPAEQPHHGQVELAVAPVGGRVDEPAPPAASSTRRLPAQRSPCRRAGGSSAAPTASSRPGQPLERRRSSAGSAPASPASRASGMQPLRGVELGPGRRTARWGAPGSRSCAGPPARSDGAPAGGSAASASPSSASVVAARAARVDPLQHEVGGRVRGPVGHRQDLRDRHGVGLPQPGQAGGLRAEEPGGRKGGSSRTRPAVVEVEAVGEGHVAAAHHGRGDHRRADCGLDGRSQRLHRRRLGPAERRSESSRGARRW